MTRAGAFVCRELETWRFPAIKIPRSTELNWDIGVEVLACFVGCQPSRWLGRARLCLCLYQTTTISGAMTILAVEDEFFVRQDIASFFQDAGWVVVEAESGYRAIAICRSDMPIDVLFTDIQLIGWEVAEAFGPRAPTLWLFIPPAIRSSWCGAFGAACTSTSHIRRRLF